MLRESEVSYRAFFCCLYRREWVVSTMHNVSETMKTVTQEINEFVDAIRTYDETDIMGSLVRCVREGIDVVGRIVNINDDPANLTELADALADAAQDFVAKALAGRPLLKGGAQAALPLVVPALVAEAAKRTDDVDAFIEAHVLPLLAQAEQFCHDARVAFGG